MPQCLCKIRGVSYAHKWLGLAQRELPASSDELVAKHEKYYSHTIEIFGAKQMYVQESNFPDKQSISYHILWNAF
ncbi:MAG: hypothetical protein CM15mP86_07970 [Gammaproteobacteria bacterium]|nr:MAG: hypothetical protein CM15mP86_07970 [Gammaproteobacteria bacterium]